MVIWFERCCWMLSIEYGILYVRADTERETGFSTKPCAFIPPYLNVKVLARSCDLLNLYHAVANTREYMYSHTYVYMYDIDANSSTCWALTVELSERNIYICIYIFIKVNPNHVSVLCFSFNILLQIIHSYIYKTYVCPCVYVFVLSWCVWICSTWLSFTIAQLSVVSCDSFVAFAALRFPAAACCLRSLWTVHHSTSLHFIHHTHSRFEDTGSRCAQKPLVV